ncbi:arsenic resistance protein [Candidatus Falkowbacteria bacterium]|nr:arsenic resistance protein [Candidatus Falkowbacteria bacterium]
MLDKILEYVQKNLFLLIVLSIAAGLSAVRLMGGIAFTPLLCLLAALLMIYPSLVPLDFKKIGSVRQHKMLVAVSLAANFIIAPLLAVVVGRIFLADEPALWLGLILLSVLPGGGMVTIWAYRSKADIALTVNIVTANLLAAIILSPFYLSAAMNKLATMAVNQPAGSCTVSEATGGIFDCAFGGAGSISPAKIALPIIFIVAIPLLLAYLTQKHYLKAGRERFETIKARYASFSNLGLLLVLFLLMSIKQNQIIFSRPDLIPKALLALLAFYGASLLLSWRLGKVVGGERGRSLVWGTYLRYITLALGLAISIVYQDPTYSLTLIVAVMAYLVQIPSSFWLANKLNNK